MNKTLLFGGVMLAAALASCSKGESTSTYTYNLNPVNIITDLTDNSTVASQGGYTITLKMNTETQYGTIEVSDLVINNSIVKFSTNEQNYKTNLYYAYFENVQSSSANLTDADFLLTPYFNYPSVYGVTATYLNPGNVLMADYIYNGQYQVKTFPLNAFYVGDTSTSYPFMGETQYYETTDIYYQLSLNKDDLSKATIMMFNAKFSGVEQEPVKKQIILDNLDVTYADGTFTVTGTDVIPYIVEGTESTPYPSYTFDSIEMKITGDDLTGCVLTYMVAGIYSGTFSGLYGSSSLNN